MEKKLLFVRFIILSVFILLGGKIYAEEEQILFIGDAGSTTLAELPLSLSTEYSYSQTIYLKEELDELLGKQITKLAYYIDVPQTQPVEPGCPLSNDSIHIYIGYTNKKSFSDPGIWDLDELKLYSKNLISIPATSDWVEIKLDTAFFYNENSNLMIAVHSIGKLDCLTSGVKFLVKEEEGINRVQMYADENDFDFNTPPIVTDVSNQIPNIRFHYETAGISLSKDVIDYGYVEIGSIPKTETITVINTGLCPLIITGLDDITDTSFSIYKTFPDTIQSNDSREITFIYTPLTAGSHSAASLEFVSNAINKITFTLQGNAYSNTSLFENFEEQIIPPKYWKTVNNSWEISNDAYYQDYAAGLNETVDTLITPRVSGIFTLYAKSQHGKTGKLKIISSDDLVSWTDILTETDVTTDYAQYPANIGDKPLFIGITGSDLLIDVLQATVLSIPEKDLSITWQGVSGSLIENTDVTIPVKVKNYGKQSESLYTINLVDAETRNVLTSVEGTDIGHFEELSFNLVWDPHRNVKKVYAEVVLTGDGEASNNRTDTVSVSVTPCDAILEITPSGEIDFGYVEIGSTPLQKTMLIKNTGLCQLIITDVKGMEDSPFSLSENTFPITIESNEDIEITFTYTPEDDDVHFKQSLSFESNAANKDEVIFSLKGNAYLSTSLFESFEGDFPPQYWKSVNGSWEKFGEAYHKDFTAGLGATADTLITPRVSDKFTLYAKSLEGGGGNLKILSSPDLIIWTEVFIKDPLPEEYALYTIALSSDTLYIGITGNNLFVDVVQARELFIPKKDLAVAGWDMPVNLTENTNETIPVTIINHGQDIEYVYTVELVDAVADTVLTYVEGTEIDRFEKKTLQLEWNPRRNITDVYARVVLSGDEVQKNDSTDIVSITVTPYEGILELSSNDEIDFGLLKRSAASKERIFTLKNTGNAPLTLNYEVDTPFSTDLTPDFVIQPEESADIKIFFNNTTGGFYKDTIQITHDGKDGIAEIALRGEMQRQGDLCGDFETENFPPAYWTITQTSGWKRQTDKVYEDLAAIYSDVSMGADTLITPKLNITEDRTISFFAATVVQNINASVALKVIASQDLREWTEIASYNENDLSDSYIRYEIEGWDTGEFYIGFVAMQEMYIDLIHGPQIIYPEFDIMVTDFIAPDFGTLNNESAFTVVVKNQGEEDCADYTVKLMNGTEVLKTVSCPGILASESIGIPITWTPRATGEYILNAIIETENDENHYNNISSYINFIVEVENLIEIKVGDEQADDSFSLSHIPVNNSFNYSFSEVLYPASDLGLVHGTLIDEISYSYYIEHGDNSVSIPLRIWVGETDLTSLSDSVIALSYLTQVYNTEHTFVYNENKNSAFAPSTTRIKFDKDYVYNGRTLVVFAEAAITDENAGAQLKFIANKVDDDNVRTVSYQNEIIPDNEEETDIDKNLLHKEDNGVIPVTGFKVKTPGVKVAGCIHDQYNKPVGGVDIKLRLGELVYSVSTDDDGNFELEIFKWNRKYDFIIEKEDYENLKCTLDIYEEDIDLGTITFQLITDYTALTLRVSAVTGESVEGGAIILKNKDTAEVLTIELPAGGEITLPPVLKGIYRLTIDKDNLRPYRCDSINFEKNLHSYTAVLLEDIVAPYSISAGVEYSETSGKGIVSLSWNDDRNAFFETFDNYENFSTFFYPWTGFDLDGGIPVQTDTTYLNSDKKQYAIIFNPKKTEPAHDNQAIMPYSGDKCVAFTNVDGMPNNDWLIAPKRLVRENDILSFMALTTGENTDAGDFRIAISTTNNEYPDQFTVITGDNDEIVGNEWTRFRYDLNEYAGEEVYIAINYIAESKKMMLVDDFYIGQEFTQTAMRARRTTNDTPEYPQYVIYLNGEKMGETTYMQYQLNEVDGGYHKIGVKAVYKTDESPAMYTYLDVLGLDNFASLTVNVNANDGSLTEGINVHLINAGCDIEYNKIVENGKIEINHAYKGEYEVEINTPNYGNHKETFYLDVAKEIEIVLKEFVDIPRYLTVDVNRNYSSLYNADLRWNQELGFREGFESYTDFTSDFSPWTVHDLDQGTPYKLTVDGKEIIFPGSGAIGTSKPMVFNPSNTTPNISSLRDATAYEGSKYIMFSSASHYPAGGYDGHSDDWVISPAQPIGEGYVLRFLLKAFPVQGVADKSEVMNIGISDNDDITSFTTIKTIKPGNMNWYRYEHDLSEYEGSTIYIGFNYSSFDCFMLQLDDVYIGPASSEVVIGTPLSYEIYLNDVYQGEVTHNFFTFTNLKPRTLYKASVVANYASGKVGPTDIIFTTPVEIVGIDENNTGFKIYPTLVTDGYLCVESDTDIDSILIYTIEGRLINTISAEIGVNTINMSNLPSGIYYLQIKTGNNYNVQKIVVGK